MPKRRANGEGSLYKRKDGSWTAQYTDCIGKKRYLYGKTQQAVKDKLKEAIRMNDNGIPGDAGRMTLAAWMDEWLEVYVRPSIKPNTYMGYYRMVHLHIMPAFQRVALKDVREPLLQRFLNEKLMKRLDGKPGGYTAAYCKLIKARLYGALDKAVELGMIPRNPAARLRLPASESKEKQILTPEQQRRLEQAVTDDLERDYTGGMILLMLYTGLRIGEVMGLQVGDINLAQKELRVRRTLSRIRLPGDEASEKVPGEPKSKTSARVIPLSGGLLDLLRGLSQQRERFIVMMTSAWEKSALHDGHWAREGYFFLSVHGNTFDITTAQRKLDLYTSAAGVPRVTLHALRHTFATRWIEAGLDIKSLSEILGHADAMMTLNIYAHSLPEQKRDSMDKLTASLCAHLT